VKKEHNGRKSLRRLNATVGCNASKRRSIYLRTKSDLCHLQHKLIGFYNRDKKCLQRGTNWVFK
jgi:hypothetical protein